MFSSAFFSYVIYCFISFLLYYFFLCMYLFWYIIFCITQFRFFIKNTLFFILSKKIWHIPVSVKINIFSYYFTYLYISLCSIFFIQILSHYFSHCIIIIDISYYNISDMFFSSNCQCIFSSSRGLSIHCVIGECKSYPN